jgi:hypothetical protein
VAARAQLSKATAALHGSNSTKWAMTRPSRRPGDPTSSPARVLHGQSQFPHLSSQASISYAMRFLVCTVGGSGTKSLPAGVGLPGAYNPDDEGIIVQLWQIDQGLRGYTAPGGPVKTI